MSASWLHFLPFLIILILNCVTLLLADQVFVKVLAQCLDVIDD